MLQALAFLAWIAFLALARATDLGNRIGGLCPARVQAMLREWHPRLRLSGYVVLVIAWAWLSRHTPTIVDARVYADIDLDHLYGKGPNEIGAYLYSPAFAQAIAPLSSLDWRTFYALWTGLDILAMAWLLGPVAAALSLGFPLVSHQVWIGNIPIFLAVAGVLATRHASVWAFLILTKATPAVGLLWLAAQRDRSGLLTACAVTAGIAIVSFVLAPRLWGYWGRILVSGAQSTSLPQSGLLPFPLWIRLGLAAVIAVVGGLFGQAWTIPVAVVAAQPIFWSIGLTTLFAVVPLATSRAQRLPIGSIRPS